MIHEVIKLHDYFNNVKEDITLTTYVPSNFKEWSIGKKRKALLIIPGGGYEFVSEREAEPIALKFMSEDIACFVLKYSVLPNMKYPEPIVEALAAVTYIRRYASKYNIEENSISVLGFSAGGHLACVASCYYNDHEYLDILGISENEAKINGCLLGYPVVSMTYTDRQSIENIAENKEELLDKLSIDRHVSKDFPSTYIWVTRYDTDVPVCNSIELAKQLCLNGVLCELHIYPHGDHGQATCDELTYPKEFTDYEEFVNMNYTKQWIDGAVHFIKNYIN